MVSADPRPERETPTPLEARLLEIAAEFDKSREPWENKRAASLREAAALERERDELRAALEAAREDLLTEDHVEAMRETLHATYNGGHSEPATIEAFHHGMDTVCNVIADHARRALAGAAPTAIESARRLVNEAGGMVLGDDDEFLSLPARAAPSDAETTGSVAWSGQLYVAERAPSETREPERARDWLREVAVPRLNGMGYVVAIRGEWDRHKPASPAPVAGAEREAPRVDCPICAGLGYFADSLGRRPCPRCAPAEPAESVKVPESEDEAAGMVLVGMAWLRAHAPHRLTPEFREPADPDARERLEALVATGLYETEGEVGYLDHIEAEREAKRLVRAALATREETPHASGSGEA